MPPTTKTRPSRVAVKEPELSSDSEEFTGFNNPQTEEAEYERDSEEDELERLVFGDAAGFRQGIKGFKTSDELAKGKELVLVDTDRETGTGLEAIDDADVCLMRL
jgi:U3 small nucleolar RNA-associated protein 18